MRCFVCVSVPPVFIPLLSVIYVDIDVDFRAQMVRENGPSSLAHGVGPNVFCAVLMNAS
jgi:hypothetical protein